MMITRNLAVAVLLFSVTAVAQGRRGVPNATPEQTTAIARMNTTLAPQMQRLATVRSELVAAAFAQPRNNEAIRARLAAVRVAELDLAKARAAAFAELQSSANKLSGDQIAAV